MKRSTIRFRFLTPTIVAAVLALPATSALSQAVDEPERDLQQREQRQETELQDQQLRQQEQQPPEALPQNESLQQEQPLREEQSLQQDQRLQQEQPHQPKDSWTSSSQYQSSKPDHSAAPQYSSKYHSSGSMHSEFGTVEKASDIIGYNVMSAATGEKLATIDDLIVDLDSGQVVLAVLRSGGLAGFGSQYVAVPPTALTPSAEESFTIDADKLSASPPIDWSNWEQTLDHTTLARIYQTHGEQYHSDSFLRSQDVQMSHRESQPQRELDQDQNLDRQPVRGAEEGLESQIQGRDNWGPAREGTISRQSSGFSSESSSDWSPQQFVGSSSASGMQLRRASDLIGADVETTTGEDLGSIKDLGVDMSNGRVVSAVVSSGGFLGIGATTRALPPMALKGGAEADQVLLQGSKAQFERAPTFSGRTWPIQDPAYVREVYQVFGIRPQFDQGARMTPAMPSSTTPAIPPTPPTPEIPGTPETPQPRDY